MLFLGRDAYSKGYSHELFERRPTFSRARGTFRNGGRQCCLSDEQAAWMFPGLELEVGQVVEVTLEVSRVPHAAPTMDDAA